MYCLTCDYDLHQCPHSACPECGRAFSATDPTTFRRSATRTSLLSWLIVVWIPCLTYWISFAWLLFESLTWQGFHDMLGPDPQSLPITKHLAYAAIFSSLITIPAAIVGVIVAALVWAIQSTSTKPPMDTRTEKPREQ